MRAQIVIPKFRELGFDVPGDTRWPAKPVPWNRHPRIWAKSVPPGAPTLRKIILYVPEYTTPNEGLRLGYYQPKHEVLFSKPDWFTLARRWLEGTGWKHAEAALHEENRKEAVARAESFYAQQYTKDLTDEGFIADPGHSVVLLQKSQSLGGPELPCGIKVTLTLQGTPKQVAHNWENIRAAALANR